MRPDCNEQRETGVITGHGMRGGDLAHTPQIKRTYAWVKNGVMSLGSRLEHTALGWLLTVLDDLTFRYPASFIALVVFENSVVSPSLSFATNRNSLSMASEPASQWALINHSRWSLGC